MVQPETVTVVFTDVVESTVWRARVGEVAADVHAAELERASREVVSSFGGNVVKSLGDGVMATFGSAVAGVEAAAVIQAVAARLAVGGGGSCLRVGVSSGDLVREGADWLGSAAIEASRLCAQASGGSVLVADVTERLCRGRSPYEFRDAGERTLRGFDTAIRVFELVHDIDGGAALPSTVSQLAGRPLVGRRAEMTVACRLLDMTANGSAATLVLAGEPGVGKTRLAAAVASEAQVRGFTVLFGHCEEGLVAPYQPVVEALGPWLAACPDVALARVVGQHGPRLAQLWPDLSVRMGLESDLLVGDPEAQRWRLFDAVVELVRSAAAERPVLLVVDDLQWAEPSTMLLLAHLARREVAGVAIVSTVRGRGSIGHAGSLLDSSGSSSLVEVVELQGLDRGAVSEFVTLHAGTHPPDELSERLRQQTDGNPFFLSALLAHVEEVAFLRTDAGVWVTTAELDVMGIPTGARMVITHRLSSLSSAARRALDVAAVQGLVFEAQIISAVLDSHVDLVVSSVDELMFAGLVREDGVARFAFSHALVRQAVLDGLSQTQAARLHRRIAEEVEHFAPHDPSRLGEIAYHHAASGALGDPESLARAALAAGHDAFLWQAFDEAAGHFTSALGALDTLDGDETRRCEVLLALGEAQSCGGHLAESKVTFLEAASVATRAHLPLQRARSALGYGGRYIWGRAADDRHLIPLLEDALASLPTADSPERVQLLGRLACARRSEPDREIGASMSAEALAMAERIGDAATLAYALEAHHGATYWYDNPEQRLQLADQQLVIAKRSEDNKRVTHVHLCRTSALLELGRIEDGEHALETFTRLADELREPAYQVMATSVRVMMALFHGEFDLAEELMVEEGRVGTAALTAEADGWLRSHEAWLRRQQGKLDGLEELMRESVARIPWYPMFRCFLAELYTDLGQWAKARCPVRRARAGWIRCPPPPRQRVAPERQRPRRRLQRPSRHRPGGRALRPPAAGSSPQRGRSVRARSRLGGPLTRCAGHYPRPFRRSRGTFHACPDRQHALPCWSVDCPHPVRTGRECFSLEPILATATPQNNS